MATKRWNLTIQNASGATTQITDRAWHSSKPEVIDEICLDSPAGPTGLAMDFDDVVAEYVPS
jgi:hypothetical protein